ncbi:MAG: corrinoid protein [Candidatus Neomarinimicrobiota bacterium]
MEILNQLTAALQIGADKTAAELTTRALEDGLTPGEILNGGFIAGMNVIGEKFKRHEIFLPEVLLAARAMQAGMDLLKPLLSQSDQRGLGTVVIGTVKGDLHDIGKNLVGIMLKGAGFEVIDLGKDVAPEKFIETAAASGAGVIGLSALLTTTMLVMKDVVDLLKKQDDLRQVKVIIGGAPASEEFAREIGADAYGFDAASAVDRVKQLLGA